MDVNLRYVRSFLAVAELKSFTRAAAALHLSQPALTVQIRKLEDALVARLLDRNSRSVELTRMGRDLLPALQRALREFDVAVADAREVSAGRGGAVRIAALPSFAASLLPGVIIACRRTTPQVAFIVQDAIASRVTALVRSEEVDFGVTGGEFDGDGLDVLHASQDRMCLIYPAGHPIGRKKAIATSDLADLPLVLTAPGTSVRQVVDAAFRGIGRFPIAACEATYMTTAVAMTKAGLGVTILPESAREPRAESGLRSRLIDDPAMARPIFIIKRRNRTLPPAAMGFLEVCMAAMGR